MPQPPNPDLTVQADHLRQLCLFRRHITDMLQSQPSGTCVALSLIHLRSALDRYQSIYTGDVLHFDTDSGDRCWVHEAAND